MLLIFGDDRLNLRQLPHLMSKGFGIGPGQLGRTTPTGIGLQGHDVIAVFRSD